VLIAQLVVKPNSITYANAQELRERIFGDAYEPKKAAKLEEGDPRQNEQR